MPGRTCGLILLIIVACACRHNVEPIKSGVSYFPIETGASAEYDITKTTYLLSQASQTSRALIRESVGDSFTDASGQVIFKLNYASNSGENNWKLDSIRTIWKTTDKILGVENGQIIIKLSLPVEDRNVWNGNAYNMLGERHYYVKNVGVPFKAGSVVFPKTVTVIRHNDSTLVRQSKHIEIYAEGVGLIQREISSFNFCYATDCKAKGTINSGWREISVIKNYSK